MSMIFILHREKYFKLKINFNSHKIKSEMFAPNSIFFFHSNNCTTIFMQIHLYSLFSTSGRRLATDSLRMIYYNDQTIAIVELGPEKLLLSCELIEI